MDFPEIVGSAAMEDLIRDGRGDHTHPIFTDGTTVVPNIGRAVQVAFFERGRVIAKYLLKGDGKWRLVSQV